MLFPDESASLASARFFAGVGGPSEWWFQPGYGIVLAPILVITRDIGWVMTWVHATNAVLAGFLVFALIRLDRTLLPERTSLVRAVAAALVGIYPAYVYFAGQAIADNLLTTATAMVALLVARCSEQTSTRLWVAATVAVCSLMMVHARALPIVLMWAFLVASRPWWSSSYRAFRGLAVLVCGFGFYFIGRGLVDYERGSALSSLTRQGLGDLLGDLGNVRAVFVLPFTTLGTVMYLIMATLGVLVLGVMAAIQQAQSGSGPRREVGVFVLGTLFLTAGLSAIFTNQGQGDLAMYGRYVEAVAAVPLFWGLLTLLEQPLPSWFRSRLVPGVVMLVCLVVGIRGYDAFDGRNQLLNVSGTASVSRLVGEIDPVAYVLLISIVMLLLGVLRDRHVVAGAVVVAAFFAANVVVLFDTAAEFSDRVQTRLELLDDIDLVASSECVALDQSGLTDFFVQENYRVNDLDRDYRFWSSESGTPTPCQSLVVSENSELGRSLIGWRPVAVEHERRAWLWVSPAMAEQQFADRAIRPLPGQPLFEPEARVTVETAVDTTQRGETVEATIQVTNTSTQTYIPLANVAGNVGGVQLGLEWRDPERPDERLHEPFRVVISGLLRPGDTVTVQGELPASVAGTTIGEGMWLVRAELVQEGVQWFGDPGGADASILIVEPDS